MIDRITEKPFYQTRVSGSTFVNADCFNVFPFIEDKSIDAIICDLPYGTTNCKWDSVLDLNKLWEQYKRILKENGVVILFAQTPFDKVLGCSNSEWLKFSTKEAAQEWIVLNKPCLSINDVLNAGYGICNPACLKELVKSRL